MHNQVVVGASPDIYYVPSQMTCPTSRLEDIKREKQRLETETSNMRAELMNVTNNFEGGLDRRAAQALHERMATLEAKLEECGHEAHR